MTSITTSVHIERPMGEVFNFVTTPGNWAQWHSSSLQVSGHSDHSPVVGGQVTKQVWRGWRNAHFVIGYNPQKGRWRVGNVVKLSGW